MISNENSRCYLSKKMTSLFSSLDFSEFKNHWILHHNPKI